MHDMHRQERKWPLPPSISPRKQGESKASPRACGLAFGRPQL